MMEIAYGPLILSCMIKSLAFATLFAMIFPAVEARFSPRPIPTGLARRVGLGVMTFGLFGLMHLAIDCAADGFPPRIVQSAALAMIMAAVVGFAILARDSAPRRLA